MRPENRVGRRSVDPGISYLELVFSLFLSKYETLAKSFGISESQFSPYKIGMITSPLTTSLGYCDCNSR